MQFLCPRFPYPSVSEIMGLSSQTKFSEEQIKVWFSAQRLKHGVSWTPEEVGALWDAFTQTHSGSGYTSSHLVRLTSDIFLVTTWEASAVTVASHTQRHGTLQATLIWSNIPSFCVNVWRMSHLAHWPGICRSCSSESVCWKRPLTVLLNLNWICCRRQLTHTHRTDPFPATAPVPLQLWIVFILIKLPDGFLINGFIDLYIKRYENGVKPLLQMPLTKASTDGMF